MHIGGISLPCRSDHAPIVDAKIRRESGLVEFGIVVCPVNIYAVGRAHLIAGVVGRDRVADDIIYVIVDIFCSDLSAVLFYVRFVDFHRVFLHPSHLSVV